MSILINRINQYLSNSLFLIHKLMSYQKSMNLFTLFRKVPVQNFQFPSLSKNMKFPSYRTIYLRQVDSNYSLKLTYIPNLKSMEPTNDKSQSNTQTDKGDFLDRAQGSIMGAFLGDA